MIRTKKHGQYFLFTLFAHIIISIVYQQSKQELHNTFQMAIINFVSIY